MIRIALCDDNKEDMLQLHQKIIEWYRENSKNQSVSITEYSDSVYLSSVIDAGDSHDAFFLDVEMPKVDGFQLADKIRNKLPAAIIVFLTSHSELAPDGYKFRALRYVSKLVFVVVKKSRHEKYLFLICFFKSRHEEYFCRSCFFKSGHGQ